MGVYTYIQSEQGMKSLYLGKFDEENIEEIERNIADMDAFCEDNSIDEVIDEIKGKLLCEIQVEDVVNTVTLLKEINEMLPYDFFDVEYYHNIKLFRRMYPDAKIVCSDSDECRIDFEEIKEVE